MGYSHFVTSKFISGLWPLSFFFTKNKLHTNSPFDGVELFWWLPFSGFLLAPVSPIPPHPESLLAGKGFFNEKVFSKMEFCILLLCPKSWNPMLFSSKLLQHFLIFLLIERLEHFLARIIFSSMDEPFLIPTELIFLDSHPCWRKFVVEQLYLPYLCYWVTVRSRYDVTVVVVSYD